MNMGPNMHHTSYDSEHICVLRFSTQICVRSVAHNDCNDVWFNQLRIALG